MVSHAPIRKATPALMLGALGVVFGDIGTSPLYALQTVFSPHSPKPVPVDQAGVYGIVSLIFWAVTLVVTMKYALFIMRADNDGEGGIMALITLIREKIPPQGKVTAVLVVLGIIGASLFYGDSVLTPAISVLSAVEGLQVVRPEFADLVVPITVGILVGLFAIQKMGTHRVGRLFGPIMLVWFVALGAIGLNKVLQHPAILEALSPHWAIEFFVHHQMIGFFALAAVVLTITGAEALYADMGHFGRPAIVRSWLLVAFPCLILNYLGQSALILHTPADISNPFFLLVPEPFRLPMVILSAVATVIASQAVLSGAFSVTRQAVQLGYLPRMRIKQTSQDIGQIYVPAINWMLLVAVLTLVVAFGSSAALAGAYGIAVTACTAIDTILFFFVVHFLWKKPWWIAALGVSFFGIIDLAFLSACATKIIEGGYIPVGIGILVCILLLTWQRGRSLLTERRQTKEGSLQGFIDQIHAMDPPLVRIPGTAVFLHPGDDTAPLAMRANFDHNHSLHEQVVILWVQTERVPHVPLEERIIVNDLGYGDDGIFHLTARFGFQDRPNIPKVLRQAQASGQLETEINVESASYFLSKMEMRRSNKPGMSSWRKRLFRAMSSGASDPVEFFYLPYDQAVIMGSHVEL